ncbi:lipid phosphate phosphatase 1 [Ceratobasidium sp. AG-Ba]|nr:lipid phosphate phosphatase 1 [Ceratobasidium sp. AG-Ba]
MARCTTRNSDSSVILCDCPNPSPLRVRLEHRLLGSHMGRLGVHAIPSVYQDTHRRISASFPLRRAHSIFSMQYFSGLTDSWQYATRTCQEYKEQAQDFKALCTTSHGHTTAAAAGYIFLSLYFNAKMKIFSDERPHFYKLLIFLAPLLGATLIGGVLTVDNSHHWYDVLAGAVIGTTGAFAAFRMSYASVWDYRFNHIPLPRPKSSWSPFTAQSKPTEHPHASAANHFKYTTGVHSFPSFAHPRGWVPAGAPGDAWDANEMGRAEAEFRRQARMGA